MEISGEPLVSFCKAQFGFLLDHVPVFTYILVECKFLLLLSVKLMDLQAFFEMQFQLYHAMCPFQKVSTNLSRLSHAVSSPDPRKGFNPYGSDFPFFLPQLFKQFQLLQLYGN